MLGNVEPISRTLRLTDASTDQISPTTLAAKPPGARYSRWGRAMLFRSVSSTYQFSALRAAEVINAVSPSHPQPLQAQTRRSQFGDNIQSIPQSRRQVQPLQAWLTHIGSLIWWSDFGKAIADAPPVASPQLTWPSSANRSNVSSERQAPRSSSSASISANLGDRAHQESPDERDAVVVKVVRPTDEAVSHSGFLFDGLANRTDLEQCLGWLPPEDVGSLKSQGKTAYQIWVKDTWVGEVANLEVAHEIAQNLNAYLQAGALQPEQIRPTRIEGWPGVKVGDQILFVANPEVTVDLSIEETWMVIGWINNLRRALGGVPLDMGSMQILLFGFDETGDRFSGVASWYGPYFHGRQTANGEVFDQYALTAAHPDLPLGTYLKVRNELNDHSVVVRVNDRGPYIGERSLDLSRAAAQCLGSEQVGVIPYEAELLNLTQPETSLNALFQSPS
ncbi:MAG: septal ring lytic transglycosylase RlpA family protein [Cyanobacteria bacterium J06635_15]